MYRAVRTTQERRANGKRCGNGVDFDGYSIRIRARRGSINLADFWDDVWRSDWRNRSWKRHRKTQYKPNGSVAETE